ncbi:uncharacterized transporter slc-17.2-like isoform X3 [Mercenaria mercenaria]|uniref:uncharacterized transporter slc-17.2-like isoform X3 n=1 Tax=Mercenaria mercenaria TaxID=6596 RepID=UPI00234EEB39|nr:uncharacterized transporter slc-17.2-like isoform X3 [Mercenaria mercenaria]
MKNDTSSSLIKDNNTIKDFRVKESPRCCAQRWLLASMGLWLGIMTYMMNSNMSIAVVCMVGSDKNLTGVYDRSNTSVYLEEEFNSSRIKLENVSEMLESPPEVCYMTEEGTTRTSKGAEFFWDKKTRSFVLSSYFYGYMVTQIPGGWFSAKIGGKSLIGACMALSSAVTLLMPLFARVSVYLLMAARVLLGMSMGMVIPGYCGLVGIWALPTERSRFMGLCWFGQMVGAILGYTTSGLLCIHGFDNGWASIFYVHGITGALFVVTWWFLIYSSPQQHPRITEAEMSLLIKHSNTQKANPKENGLYSCLPFISFMAGIAFAGVCADLIRKKKCFTVTTIRKMLQLTGLFGVTVFILIPGYLTCEQRDIAIMCLCFCTLFEGIGVTGGYTSNSIDIAPRYASVIFAVSNTIASIPGILAPLVVAEITKNQSSEEWRVVFYMSAGVSMFAALLYGIFANSELAPWANMNIDKELDIEVDISRSSSMRSGFLEKPTVKEDL